MFLYKEPSVMLGLTIVDIKGGTGDDCMLFKTSCGRTFQLLHEQDCCETVYVEDISGNLSDLLNTPLLRSEEITGTQEDRAGLFGDDSYKWTYYKFGTIKGDVDIRWYGCSNGYYSEDVSFTEIK